MRNEYTLRELFTDPGFASHFAEQERLRAAEALRVRSIEAIPRDVLHKRVREEIGIWAGRFANLGVGTSEVSALTERLLAASLSDEEALREISEEVRQLQPSHGSNKWLWQIHMFAAILCRLDRAPAFVLPGLITVIAGLVEEHERQEACDAVVLRLCPEVVVDSVVRPYTAAMPRHPLHQ